jgi:hypothetical protein
MHRLVCSALLAGILACASCTTSGKESLPPTSPLITGGSPLASASSAASGSSSARPGPGAGCQTRCAAGEDGMQYTVTGIRRFTDIGNEPLLAVRFSITNTSAQPHDFDPMLGGFNAYLSSAGDVQQTDFRSSHQSGDPTCFTDPKLDIGSTTGDPPTLHVAAGATLAMAKDMCFLDPHAQTLTHLNFADNDVSNDAVVTISPPA